MRKHRELRMPSEWQTNIELLQGMRTMEMNGNNNMITAYLKLQQKKGKEKKKQRKRKPDQLRFFRLKGTMKRKRGKNTITEKLLATKTIQAKKKKKQQIRKFILIFLPLTFSSFGF